jgi:hypothetical protein
MASNSNAGAPTKLTPDVHKIIVEAVRKGLPWVHAGNLAGVCEKTVINWREQGAIDTEGVYFQFLQDLKRAKAEWVKEQLEIIHEAATTGSWQAAAWGLERRDPDHFALKNKHEISGAPGEPLEVKVTIQK